MKLDIGGASYVLRTRRSARGVDLATYLDQATVLTTKGVSHCRGQFRSREHLRRSGKTRRKSSARHRYSPIGEVGRQMCWICVC